MATAAEHKESSQVLLSFFMRLIAHGGYRDCHLTFAMTRTIWSAQRRTDGVAVDRAVSWHLFLRAQCLKRRLPAYPLGRTIA